MKILYNHIEEHKLFIIKWTGDWNIESYKKSMKNFIDITSKVPVDSVIQDITELNFDINFKEIDELIKLRSNIIKSTYRTVHITKRPQDVVFAELYSEELDNRDYLYCRTIKKAIEILTLSLSEKELTLLFSKLNKDLINR